MRAAKSGHTRCPDGYAAGSGRFTATGVGKAGEAKAEQCQGARLWYRGIGMVVTLEGESITGKFDGGVEFAAEIEVDIAIGL